MTIPEPPATRVHRAGTTVIIGGHPESLNFRALLIQGLASASQRVLCMAAPASPEVVRSVEAHADNVSFLPYPVARNGLDPREDLGTLRALRRIFHRERPDIVLAYNIKPIVWGGLAITSLQPNKRTGRTRFYVLITGLGYALHDGGGWKRNLLGGVAASLYRLALRRADMVFFQNKDNQALFRHKRLLGTTPSCVIAGQGVDTGRYAPTPLPPTGDGRPVVFLLIARLLGDKGLREYRDAARQVRQRFPEARFRLLGPPDPSPDGIPEATVRGWHADGEIEYLGETDDVRPFLADCHVYVLPSYHEGMPRTVLEAMAMGRPILTTDIPGARETVEAGVNGWLVPARDAGALAERCAWFLEHPERWTGMGAASRRLAEERFDVHQVNRTMLSAMGLA